MCLIHELFIFMYVVQKLHSFQISPNFELAFEQFGEIKEAIVITFNCFFN
jgi:hypothetical protein